jgi:tetratricopeptide (TPR) repeat protein
VRLGEGWSVSARVTGQNAVSAAGPELDPLVTQVAEGVFRQTQPYRYAIYLVGRGRAEEALAAARALSLSGPAEERPWGLVAYANALSGPSIGERERLPALRRAAEAVPDFPMPLNNYADALELLGRWEEALPLHRRVAAMVGDGSAISEEFRGQYLAGKTAGADLLTGAFVEAAAASEAASRVGTPTYAAGYLRDAIAARYLAHDPRAGDRNRERLIELLGYNMDSNQVAALGVANLGEAQRIQLLFRTGMPALRAAGIGDRQALQRELPARIALMRSLVGSFEPAAARDVARSLWPLLAPELARIARPDEAEALLAPLERDCYPCLVARGEVAAAKGDRAAARRWFAEAVRRGPSLPFAHAALGRMLAQAGDRAGAEAAFARAERIEPRYADAWKHHGDLLARTGASREAARLYARGAPHAPRWGALHIEWGKALWRAGERDEARAKFRAAAGMDLSAADRARLKRIWAAAKGRAI